MAGSSPPGRLERAREYLSFVNLVSSTVAALATTSGSLGLWALISTLWEAGFGDVQRLKQYLLIAVIAISIFLVTGGYLIVSAMRMRRSIKRHFNISPLFLLTAHDNALCDKALFLSLFVELNNAIARERKIYNALSAFLVKNVKKAEEQCRDNITKIVSHAKSIFDASTGDVCAVTIKAVDRTTGSVGLVLRDPLSKLRRQENEEKDFKIEDNTAFIVTIHQDNRFYVCDNLVAAHRKHEYTNGRDKWWEDYNATLVYRISSADAPQFDWALCIDNLKGGFNRKEMIDTAAELGERLTVMIHRMLSLKTIGATLQQEGGRDVGAR